MLESMNVPVCKLYIKRNFVDKFNSLYIMNLAVVKWSECKGTFDSVGLAQKIISL